MLNTDTQRPFAYTLWPEVGYKSKNKKYSLTPGFWLKIFIILSTVFSLESYEDCMYM